MGGTKMCNLLAQLKFDTGCVYSYKFRRINLTRMQRGQVQLNEQLLSHITLCLHKNVKNIYKIIEIHLFNNRYDIKGNKNVKIPWVLLLSLWFHMLEC